jgi:hypothetical protein
MSARLFFAFALGLFTGIVAAITIFRANHTFPDLDECIVIVEKGYHGRNINDTERNAIVAIVWVYITQCLGVK